MCSFLLIGYFSAGWLEKYIAFDWLHSIEYPIPQLIIYMISDTGIEINRDADNTQKITQDYELGGLDTKCRKTKVVMFG
jgi:hypothetical protein